MANKRPNTQSASIAEGVELGDVEAANYVRLHAVPSYPDATMETSETASTGGGGISNADDVA